jgi:hypothetical protein
MWHSRAKYIKHEFGQHLASRTNLFVKNLLSMEAFGDVDG